LAPFYKMKEAISLPPFITIVWINKFISNFILLYTSFNSFTPFLINTFFFWIRAFWRRRTILSSSIFFLKNYLKKNFSKILTIFLAFLRSFCLCLFSLFLAVFNSSASFLAIFLSSNSLSKSSFKACFWICSSLSCSLLLLFRKIWNSALPAAAEEPTTFRTNSGGGFGFGSSFRWGIIIGLSFLKRKLKRIVFRINYNIFFKSI